MPNEDKTTETKPSRRDPRDVLLLDLMDTLKRLLVYRDGDAAREHFNMARDRWRKSRECNQ